MAILGRRQPFKPLIRTYLKYAAPLAPPIGVRVIVRGAFAAQQAANFAHRPLFPIRIGTFVPRRLSGHLKKPFLPRVPKPLAPTSASLLARFTEIMSATYNSLSMQGYLRQTGTDYSIVGGGVSEARAPAATDDAEAGFNPGAVWVDTTTQKVWFCVDNTIGTAVWKTPF